jgi:hypothetical protein
MVNVNIYFQTSPASEAKEREKENRELLGTLFSIHREKKEREYVIWIYVQAELACDITIVYYTVCTYIMYDA